MKHISLIAAILISSLFCMTTSYSMEQVLPVYAPYECKSSIYIPDEFSGLEEKVKIKIAERYSIPINAITSCYYDGVFRKDGADIYLPLPLSRVSSL